MAFLADRVVEGLPTGGKGYCPGIWDPMLAQVSMFAGMFGTGPWRDRKVILECLHPRGRGGGGA